MEYYILCHVDEDVIRFVEEYERDGNGNITFSTTGSFNLAFCFDDLEYARKVARKITHKHDKNGNYICSISVKSADFIIEHNLNY